MMSIECIIAINEEIAAEAAQRGLVPFVPANADSVDRFGPFAFPNLGYLHPVGWEKTESFWFCDKWGVGLEYEPALTWRSLKRELEVYIEDHPTHGFAVTEESEFQAVVSAFAPVDEDHDG